MFLLFMSGLSPLSPKPTTPEPTISSRGHQRPISAELEHQIRPEEYLTTASSKLGLEFPEARGTAKAERGVMWQACSQNRIKDAVETQRWTTDSGIADFRAQAQPVTKCQSEIQPQRHQRWQRRTKYENSKLQDAG